MLGLSGTLSYAVFVYLCIFVFVFGLGRSQLDQFGQKNASLLSSTFLFERPKLRYVLKTVLHCKGSQISCTAITRVSRSSKKKYDGDSPTPGNKIQNLSTRFLLQRGALVSDAQNLSTPLDRGGHCVSGVPCFT